jgi:CRP-like cAMP-binding protein
MAHPSNAQIRRGQLMHSNGNPVPRDQIRDLALFAAMDEDSLADIALGGWVVEHKRGTRVVGRGDFLEGLYTVLEGRLKLYMLSCHGDERVLRVLEPGATFGEAIMFNEIPSPVFVDTLSAVRLAYFPHSVISEALARDPQFTRTMLQSMSGVMRMLIQDLETCCLQNARQRIVNYLLRAADTVPPPHIEIHLPAPKAVVASTLNISAETFSRELHRLHGKGLIEINRRTIYLREPDALRAIAEGSAAELAQ